MALALTMIWPKVFDPGVTYQSLLLLQQREAPEEDEVDQHVSFLGDTHHKALNRMTPAERHVLLLYRLAL